MARMKSYIVALIMWRILRANTPRLLGEGRSRTMLNLTRYRRVVEAIIQSAAIYSIASASLAITIFTSPNFGYLAVSQLLSPLIVRRLHLYIEGA